MDNMSRSQAKALKEQRADMERALEHGPTRRVLRRMLDNSGLFMRNPDGDPYQEGRRSVALGLVAEMNAIDVHQFPRLLQEGANEVTRSRVADRNTENDNV